MAATAPPQWDPFLARRFVASRQRHRLEPYLTDPVGFVDQFVQGMDLTPYQAESLQAIATGGKATARGPRGLGKTSLSALAILWVAVTREALGIDWKIITTAGSWAQLKFFLWPEVHRWARRLDWDALGMEPWRTDSQLLKTGISLDHGQASSASPDRPELIEGAHAQHVFVVFDEAKSIGVEVFDALEGVFSNIGDASEDVGMALAVSTPGAPMGRFHELHQRRPGTEDWHVVAVSFEQARDAGRVTDEYRDRLAGLWGEDSALFAQHVLGQFAADDDESLIPIAWVEAAFDRWRERTDPESGWAAPPVDRLGVDVARHGRDKTIVAVGTGSDHLAELRELPRDRNLALTRGRISTLMAELGAPGATVVVDADGMGAGLADEMATAGKSVVVFHGAPRVQEWRDRSGHREAFNRRSAAWWSLAERLDPRHEPTLALPPSDELIGDLTGPRSVPDPQGRIRLESKDQTKSRLGRSPDRGDAAVLWNWRDPAPTTPAAIGGSKMTEEWSAQANADWAGGSDGGRW